METIGLVFLITKAATAGYVLLASITALILLFCCRAFNKLTYRLFIYVLSVTIVLSLAIEFDTATVGALSYRRMDFQDNTSQITATLCAISGPTYSQIFCLLFVFLFSSGASFFQFVRTAILTSQATLQAMTRMSNHIA